MPRGEDDFDAKKCTCCSGVQRKTPSVTRGNFPDLCLRQVPVQKARRLQTRRADRSELLGRRGH